MTSMYYLGFVFFYLKPDIVVVGRTSHTGKEILLMDEPIVSDVALPQMHVELPEALREPTRSKNLLFMALYAVANMVILVGNISIASILLPEQIATFTPGNQTTIFSLILGLGAVTAVVTNPVVGMFSDRTTLRLGRRRPCSIAGRTLTGPDLLLMAHAPSPLLVAIAYFFFQLPTHTIY